MVEKLAVRPTSDSVGLRVRHRELKIKIKNNMSIRILKHQFNGTRLDREHEIFVLLFHI